MHDGDRRDGGEDGDRNVDEQAPAPGDVLREHAAEEDADRPSGARDGTVGAERLRPLLGVVLEGDGQDGQGGGCHQRGEPALQGAGGEEHRLVDGQATERRCAGEAQQPDDEHPLATPESAIRPPSSRKPPKARVYAVMTHWRLAVEISRACCADGSAIVTIDASRTIISCATMTTARMPQRLGSGPFVQQLRGQSVTISFDSTALSLPFPETDGTFEGSSES